MQKFPSVLAEAAMTQLLLHFLEPKVLAALYLCQLRDALHPHSATAPEESLTMAHSGRGHVPAGAPDELRGYIAQEASLGRSKLP